MDDAADTDTKEFAVQCPWCERAALIAAVNCGLFICGNDSGTPNSAVERVLRAPLSQHTAEAVLARLRMVLPATGCYRQFMVRAPNTAPLRTVNDRLIGQ
jgi:hypothetical protein